MNCAMRWDVTQDMNWERVVQCTWAIATATGQVKGTGFFISPQGHVLTSAHVVEATAYHPYINGHAAEIVYLGEASSDDFAVLRVPNPSGQSVPIGFSFQPTDPFLSIGYGRPDFPEQGATIQGTITDINVQSDFGRPMLRLLGAGDAQRFEGGYSGSPVYNLNTRRVIGLIAARDGERGGLAFPMIQVQHRWNPLVSLTYTIEKPGSSVPIDSPFYIKRFRKQSQQVYLDDYCCEAILKPYALLCIQAPQLMGKTSLMNRMLKYASQQGCRIVRLDLNEAEFTGGLSAFLYWFCQKVTRELGLDNQLDRHWNADMCITSCTNYFEDYLLPKVLLPKELSTRSMEAISSEGSAATASNTVPFLILSIDGIDRTFPSPHKPVPSPELAMGFCSMLRAWHERGKLSNRLWERLNLVLTHSTDVYIDLGDQSPFNVGEPIDLPELTPEQAHTLVNCHGLDWHDSQLKSLMAMVGGHPYLLQLALYELSTQGMSLEQLLQEAPTEAGIYRKHLHHLLKLCRKYNLEETLRKVMLADEAIQLDPIDGSILHGMGVIKWHGNAAVSRCELYRLYFSAYYLNL